MVDNTAAHTNRELVSVDRPRDDKGRVEIARLSDRELLEEIATSFRFISDAFMQMQESPMLSNMMRMFGNGKR
jgi:hypothetical protein